MTNTNIPRSPIRTQSVLGVPVSAINLQSAVTTIADWIDGDQREYICVTDAHCVVQAYRHPQIAQVYRNAGMVTPDGMPLVWMCKWAGHRQTARVYGPDLVRAVMSDPNLRYKRHFFYGGAEGVANRLADLLGKEYPGLVVAGTHCPPFRPYTDAEAADIITSINATSPDIIWVGLGAPKQELWMAKYRGALNAPVIAGVGAAFDFISGAKPQAPRWMQASGLEWLFRMASEPCRLAPRYLKTIPQFAFLAILQIMGLRRFPLRVRP